jgi:ferredoxin
MSTSFFLPALGTILLVLVLTLLYAERGRLLQPSTWKSARAAGLRRIVNLTALHGYIFGRWTNQYMHTLIYSVFPRLSEAGKRWWADRTHGKVLTHSQASAIISINKDIALRDLEHIVPYPMARDLVLKGPPDVVVFDCPCRFSREEHCEPTQVCMVIGQPFAQFTLEHKPHESRKLTQAEALDLLRTEHERGHFHSAWFKEIMLNRFCGICNCCKCCCGGLEAMTRYGIPIMASSGYVAQIDEDLCNACDICVGACPFGALSTDGVAHLNWNKCMGCGVCVTQCSLEAISLVRDERKGMPLDVEVFAHEQTALRS